MPEPVERRLSPERLSQARRVFTDYWGWHPEAVQRAGNDLLAEVDALRAERDEAQAERSIIHDLYIAACTNCETWRLAAIDAQAERDAAAPILEAATDFVAEMRDARRVHGFRSPFERTAVCHAYDVLAALFHDDQPAEDATQEKP